MIPARVGDLATSENVARLPAGTVVEWPPAHWAGLRAAKVAADVWHADGAGDCRLSDSDVAFGSPQIVALPPLRAPGHMTPARKEHIATVIARNLDASARQVTGPTGEALANAADVIRELLAALEEAEQRGAEQERAWVIGWLGSFDGAEEGDRYMLGIVIAEHIGNGVHRACDPSAPKIPALDPVLRWSDRKNRCVYRESGRRFNLVKPARYRLDTDKID